MHLDSAITVTRLHDPKDHRASFSIQTPARKIVIDPTEESDLERADYLVFTHEHPDHIITDPLSQPFKGTAIMAPHTAVLARHLIPSLSYNFPHLLEKPPHQTHPLGKSTTLQFLRASHGTIGAHIVELKTTDPNSTIVHTGDLRDGDRTTFSSQRLTIHPDLLIADASGHHKTQGLTAEQQQLRIAQALAIARIMNVPSALKLKFGDLGLIPETIKSGSFPSPHDTFFQPSISDILDEIDWKPELASKLGFTPFQIYEGNRLKPGQLLVFDRQWGQPSQPHVLINADNKRDTPYRTENTLAIVPAHRRGHTRAGYEQVFEATQPLNHTFSHPPTPPSAVFAEFPSRRQNYVLARLNSTFEII